MSFASLSNLRILITGSSAGIGRSIALHCAKAGAEVIVNCCSSTDKALQVVQEIKSGGGQASFIQADVQQADQRLRLLEEATRNGPLDGLVNNAGADLLTTDLRSAPFSERLATLLNTDVQGTIELSRLVGQQMLERGSGVILTMGWDQSDRGMEGDSGELFSTAKNAIMGFSRSLAVSLAPAVRVNCIAPGWIKTAWGETAPDYWQQRVIQETPLQRWGTPDDIAALARFLLSDESSFITGQVINVNGGAVR